MSELAIRAVDLSKAYQINKSSVGATYRTLRDDIGEIIRAPRRRFFAEKRETVWALRNASFDIRRGEVVGIVGRNGAGKSTLLKVLSRITRPSTGFADIYGRVGALLEVGTGFHPELTGRENVFLNGAILGMRRSEIARRFDAIVAFAEMERFVDTPTKQYSSGMFLRLAFSVAAHLEADILMVDEVLAVGDMRFQQKCLTKMHDAASQGRTVLFVSHQMATIANVCSRGILLVGGGIAMDGPVRDVISRYMSSSVLEERGSVTWPDDATAPGGDGFRLLAVTVLGDAGHPTGSVSSSETVRVRLRYRNLQDGARYAFNVNLRDQDGTFVFTSVSTPSATIGPDPWFDRPQPEGVLETTCEIPPDFLNTHTYYASVSVVAWRAVLGDSLVQLEDVVAFTVHDSGSMTKEYNFVWHGPIRTRLRWTTELKETADDRQDPLRAGRLG